MKSLPTDAVPPKTASYAPYKNRNGKIGIERTLLKRMGENLGFAQEGLRNKIRIHVKSLPIKGIY